MQPILMTVITTTVGTITGLVIGYLVNALKNSKNRNTNQDEALRNLLKSNLVNQYYVYKEIGKVPRYIKETWYAMYESYVKLDGNSFVRDDIKPKWDALDISED